jgi:hypothetical protein
VRHTGLHDARVLSSCGCVLRLSARRPAQGARPPQRAAPVLSLFAVVWMRARNSRRGKHRPHKRFQELPIAWSSETATAFSQALEVILFDDDAVEGDGILASAFLPIAALAVDVALNGTYDLVSASKQKVGRLHATIQWA